MRLTIERIRNLVLAAGVLLIVVLAVFFAVGRWKSPFNRRDIPRRLGIDVQQEANGVTYTQAHGGHTIFKIHASRVVQLKNDEATLHDVQIELYGQNGGSVDRIQGDEFQYDQKTGIATAAGPVEITLMRPLPASAGAAKPNPPAHAAPASNQIHVKTSGLVFNQQTGMVSTSQRVDFSTAQGSGSAIGATYNSDQGLLVLDQAVELNTRQGGNPVELHAQHAEFDRNTNVSRLRNATAVTPGDHVSAAAALIAFRPDGSVDRLDASGGVTVSTQDGSRLAAPRGAMRFDRNNRPRSGRFEGGVTLQSAGAGRQMSGASPVLLLAFNSAGELRHAHFENGVEMRSRQQGNAVVNGRTVPTESIRTWRSSIADVDFREVKGKGEGNGNGEGKVEPAQIHGTGNVVITGESRRGSEPALPSRLAADEVTGLFGPRSTLRFLTGVGHAAIEETTATGAQQTATGDRLQARFVPSAPGPISPAASSQGASAAPEQVQSAALEGNVTLVQQPAAKPGAAPQPPLRATAGRAEYQAAGQWMHLTINPRVEDAGMVLTAGKIDVSQQSGDAFAHGNVKATWIEAPAPNQDAPASVVTFGGKGPVHAIAAEAQFHQPTGQASFRGHARLWQQENFITAPLIVIDRQKQTLVAKAQAPAEPVIAVLLNAESQPADSAAHPAARSTRPSLIRVRGGDLWYSDAEREAIMRAGPLSAVTAESNGVESTSAQVELLLAPPGTPKKTPGTAPAQVESMTAVGHVLLTSDHRRGTGEQLVYTGSNDNYVLTGTPSAPPRLTDPQRGSVSGDVLIFNSRDDSVSIEGAGHQTTTETTAPR